MAWLVKVGSRLSQGSKVTRDQASGEQSGRALRPGRWPPHSRATPATPPGGEMHPGKVLAHSRGCPEKRTMTRNRSPGPVQTTKITISLNDKLSPSHHPSNPQKQKPDKQKQRNARRNLKTTVWPTALFSNPMRPRAGRQRQTCKVLDEWTSNNHTQTSSWTQQLRTRSS